jgi:outer membrane PBP1 activator LpoA protein
MRRPTIGISLVRAVLRQGRSAAIVLLALVLAACATIGTEEPAVESADATRAEALYKAGDMDEAAAAFRALAESSSGDAAAHYRLRSAEALREAGDLEAAARELGDLKRRRLHGTDPMRLDVLDAEIALAHGEFAQARALLAMPIAELPPTLRARALELRARAEVAAGDRYAAARTRAQLDRYLDGADRDQNRREIVETLGALDTGELKARAETLTPDDALRPWIEQALRAKGEALARTLPRPNRPVGTMQPGHAGAYESEGYAPPQRVALLLPLNAQLAAVAGSIRDGFLAAYFASDDQHRPEIRIYDSGKTPADGVAAYREAVTDGADHVVGPLQRESVG